MKLPDTDTVKIEKGTSLWSNSWYRLKQNRLAMIGLVVLILIVLFPCSPRGSPPTPMRPRTSIWAQHPHRRITCWGRMFSAGTC